MFIAADKPVKVQPKNMVPKRLIKNIGQSMKGSKELKKKTKNLTKFNAIVSKKSPTKFKAVFTKDFPQISEVVAQVKKRYHEHCGKIENIQVNFLQDVRKMVVGGSKKVRKDSGMNDGPIKNTMKESVEEMSKEVSEKLTVKQT